MDTAFLSRRTAAISWLAQTKLSRGERTAGSAHRTRRLGMGRLREGRPESQQFHGPTQGAPRLGELAIEGCKARSGLESDAKVQVHASSPSKRSLIGEPSC